MFVDWSFEVGLVGDNSAVLSGLLSPIPSGWCSHLGRYDDQMDAPPFPGVEMQLVATLEVGQPHEAPHR